MNNLRGKFYLSRLENVGSLDEVKEANLSEKQWLKRLELKWSQKKRRYLSLDDEIIEYLPPHPNLKLLRILCYGGSKMPSWISDPSFVNIVNITLFKCESCQVLPSLGQLPSLESLSLYELNALRIISCRSDQDIPLAGESDVAFPKLEKLEICSMFHLEEWRDPKEHDFPSLAEITVKDCPQLVAFMKSFGSPSLKHLEITNCPKLPCLPGEVPYVETLVIDSCPLLASSCSKEDGQDWQKTLLIPSIFIDQTELHSRD